jgi:hypothetical protein
MSLIVLAKKKYQTIGIRQIPTPVGKRISVANADITIAITSRLASYPTVSRER